MRSRCGWYDRGKAEEIRRNCAMAPPCQGTVYPMLGEGREEEGSWEEKSVRKKMCKQSPNTAAKGQWTDREKQICASKVQTPMPKANGRSGWPRGSISRQCLVGGIYRGTMGWTRFGCCLNQSYAMLWTSKVAYSLKIP